MKEHNQAKLEKALQEIIRNKFAYMCENNRQHKLSEPIIDGQFIKIVCPYCNFTKIIVPSYLSNE